VAGALLLTRLPLRNLPIAALLAWMAPGIFRLFPGFVTVLLVAAVLLALTDMFSALTDIALTALVQSHIAQRHMAKVMGPGRQESWEHWPFHPFWPASLSLTSGSRAGLLSQKLYS
jgi:hypothetical protein